MELCLAMKERHGVSLRRACEALRLSRAAPYYRSRRADDTPVIEAISTYIAANPGEGFSLLHRTFRREGRPWGKSRLWRVYRELRLNLPRRGKRRLPERTRDPLAVPLAPATLLRMSLRTMPDSISALAMLPLAVFDPSPG